MPEVIRIALRQLHQSFVEQGHSDASLMSVDSSLMHAHGNVWHSKQMKAGELPSCGNIDTEAHWGVSGAGKWVYGYRLHSLMSCGPYGLELPYDTTVEPANIKDAEVFKTVFVPSLPQGTEVILADTGYDDESCYKLTDAKEISLLAPIKVKKNTPPERRERAELFYSPEAREVYCLRKTTIEPYQGQLKDLFKLEHLKGLRNVCALAMLATLAYLFLVRLNLCLNRPATQLKTTLYALK